MCVRVQILTGSFFFCVCKSEHTKLSILQKKKNSSEFFLILWIYVLSTCVLAKRRRNSSLKGHTPPPLQTSGPRGRQRLRVQLPRLFRGSANGSLAVVAPGLTDVHRRPLRHTPPTLCPCMSFSTASPSFHDADSSGTWGGVGGALGCDARGGGEGRVSNLQRR